jgi:hypothetical protein
VSDAGCRQLQGKLHVWSAGCHRCLRQAGSTAAGQPGLISRTYGGTARVRNRCGAWYGLLLALVIIAWICSRQGWHGLWAMLAGVSCRGGHMCVLLAVMKWIHLERIQSRVSG